MFKNLLSLLVSKFPKRKTRVDFRLVTYSEAEDLLKKSWTLAKEEDKNHMTGLVYLELLEDKSRKSIINKASKELDCLQDYGFENDEAYNFHYDRGDVD